MGKGLVPPLQFYPTEDGELQIEVQHEEYDEQYSYATLSRLHVKYIITMLQDWYSESESAKEELVFHIPD